MTSRPFPPSPRRRALARQAGLSAASPIVGASAAWIGGLVALAAIGASTATRLGDWIAAACRGEGPPIATAADATVALALPVIAAVAIAATIAHLAQTRTLWLPRRRIAGAPGLDPHRARDGAIALARVGVIGGVVLGWLWQMAPRLAALPALAPGAALGGSAALVASAVAALAIAAVALGVLDALVRHADHARALAMTHAEKREDERLSAPDPRWRRRRRASALPDVALAAVVVAGDRIAVAVAWDPVRRPIPARIASGRGIAATQILALARRHRVPVHRDPALAVALATGDGDAIAEALWPRLAELVRGRAA